MEQALNGGSLIPALSRRDAGEVAFASSARDGVLYANS